MNAQEKKKLLKKIARRLEEGLVLVEGKKDLRALEEAGVHAPRTMAVNSASAERVADACAREANGESILLLFDFDEEGRRKANEFEQALLALGASVDRQGRRAFRALFRLRSVEELPRAMREVEKELSLKKVV